MINSSKDLTVNPQKGGLEVIVPTHITDQDPIADQSTRRTTQQRIQPAAVKSRFITNLPFTNNPDINTADPLFSDPVLVANGTSYTHQWWTHSPAGQQVFGIPFTSLYISTTPTPFDSLTFANKWPNATYHMGNFPVLIWNDQYWSDKLYIYTYYTMYNNSGDDVYVISTMRMRMLMDSGNTSVTQ